MSKKRKEKAADITQKTISELMEEKDITKADIQKMFDKIPPSEDQQLKIVEALKKLAAKKEELDELYDLRQSRIEEVNEAEKNFAKISPEIQMLQEKIEAFEFEKKEKANDTKKAKDLLDTSSKVLARMNDILLVHTTATIYQIYKHQCEQIIVSESDIRFFEDLEEETKGIFSPESVFYRGADSFLEKFPKKLTKEYSNTELDSILAYCEMVVSLNKRTPETQRIFTAYNNEDIKEILRLNGVEETAAF